MGFIDDLPPDGLTEIEKVAIYLGILYIIATAFTAWLITRKRSRAVRVVTEYESSPSRGSDDTSDITFDNDQDMLANLNAEMSGAITSLATIKQINEADEISSQAYSILEGEYMSIINEAKNQIAIMQQNLAPKGADVEEYQEYVESSTRTDQMGEIEADLQAQLMELESDDDFLRPGRKKTPISRIDPSATPVEPAATAGSIEAPQPPSKPVTNQPTPMHSTPEPTNIAPPPKAATSIAPPPAAQVPTTVTPIAPPPLGVSTPTPVATEPIAAAQPKQVKNEESEQIFAKSTSIAALRMDMLRELARLKKLINEDD